MPSALQAIKVAEKIASFSVPAVQLAKVGTKSRAGSWLWEEMIHQTGKVVHVENQHSQKVDIQFPRD